MKNYNHLERKLKEVERKIKILLLIHLKKMNCKVLRVNYPLLKKNLMIKLNN